MAVTSLWAVKSNPAEVIDYVRIPAKTVEPSLKEVLEPASRGDKTEERKYVSCINCRSVETAAREFMAVKRIWGKTEGRACFHGYQSFREREVDAEMAHTIGVELAENLWGDHFQVVVATHCNTSHYHNHFVLNSVSMVDGHHFVNRPSDYRAMRAMSDELCRKYGLSVIETPRGKGRNYLEYSAEKNGRPTFRGTIRADIDRAAAASLTLEEFCCHLQQAGYQLKLYKENGDRLERPGLMPPGGQHFFLFDKLGNGYGLSEIEQRICQNPGEKELFPEGEQEEVQQYRSSHPAPQYVPVQKPCLYRLYQRYCYELHILERHPASVRQVSSFLREDLTRLNRLDAQARILDDHQISSLADLETYKKDAIRKQQDLKDQRDQLRGRQEAMKKKDPEGAEKLRLQIADLTGRLRNLRMEVVLCDEVAARSAQTQAELDQLLSEMEASCAP